MKINSRHPGQSIYPEDTCSDSKPYLMRLSRFQISCFLLLLSLFTPSLLDAAERSSRHEAARLVFGTFFMSFIIFWGSFGLVAVALIYTLLKPGRVIGGTAILRDKPIKCFFCGILGMAFYLLLLTVSVKFLPMPAYAATSLFVLAILFIHSIVGASLVFNYFGEKLLANTSSRFIGSSFMSVLVGGISICAVNIFPLFGQMLFLVLLASGIGTVIVSMLAPGKPKDIR